MAEEIETKPEEIITEQPKTGCLDKIKTHKFKILAGVLGIFVLAGAVFGAYKVGQIQPGPGPTPTPEAIATPTPDPTADWKTYTNIKYGYSIKYPSDWVLRLDKQVPDQIVNFKNIEELYRLSSNLSIYSGGAHTAVSPSAVLSETKSVTIAGQEATKEVYETPFGEEGLLEWIKFSEELKVGQIAIYKHGEGKEHSDTLNLMLSTFKFLESSTISPTPITQNYPRPSNWETVTIPAMEISLCLPPKWVVGTDHYSDDYREIFFERDPGYRPRATSISKISYSGGSRREEYINSKVQYEYEPEKLKEETTVKEIIINGRSVLDIAIPYFPEELVFVMGDFLYSVDVDYKNLVNDSPSAFQKDIYTIVGCIKPI